MGRDVLGEEMDGEGMHGGYMGICMGESSPAVTKSRDQSSWQRQNTPHAQPVRVHIAHAPRHSPPHIHLRKVMSGSTRHTLGTHTRSHTATTHALQLTVRRCAGLLSVRCSKSVRVCIHRHYCLHPYLIPARSRIRTLMPTLTHLTYAGAVQPPVWTQVHLEVHDASLELLR